MKNRPTWSGIQDQGGVLVIPRGPESMTTWS